MDVKREEYFQLVAALITGVAQRPERQMYSAWEMQQVVSEALQGVEQGITISGGRVVADDHGNDGGV